MRVGLPILFFTFFLIFNSISIYAQKKLLIEKGKVDFKSIAQLETIRANTTKIIGVIDPATNQFVFSVDVSSFNGFKNQHQKEHFKENYLETDKYPKATFKGKIIEKIDFEADSTYEIRAKGDLDIHGLKQNRIIKVTISIKKDIVTVESHFIVPLVDHNISIPRIVNQKIATEIEIDLTVSMTPEK